MRQKTEQAGGCVRTILTVAALSVALAGTTPAQKGEVYKIGNGVTSPRLTKEVKPNYTDGAKQRRVEGSVELSAVVLADGTVGDEVKVTRSLDEELDQEAVKAARQWRFQPGTKDGKPVAVQVDIEMTFTLKDRAPR
jgi:TonB family protein